ncbi:hypothetical protein [Pseudomonas sp. MSSRFD41]|uniref:hypothetical protein n=1 Tax=Pseudomonas sp. MSSRFD41 TaxID=1310370 RepID=UPI003917B94C
MRGLLHRHPLDDAPLIDALQQALRHDFDPQGAVQLGRFMNMSGGAPLVANPFTLLHEGHNGVRGKAEAAPPA